MNIDVHGVVSVELLEIKTHSSSSDKPFVTREISITDARGNSVDITLYTDVSEKLEVKV